MAYQKKLTRRLNGYALDPGFSTQLDTMGVNEIVYEIKWEKNLEKGPVGEYFEVIDYDPASNCFYDPVDLNDIEILAQNGLPASESNPKFHQQFVYTIAMKTLEHFEKSLGRRIIWSPRAIIKKGQENDEPDRGYEMEYVDRLRLYPHAFRQANAYYDTSRKAVLFGYFEAGSKIQGSNLPGGVIFTCLSPDIVSHELTHGLLDSIHPRFIENTNRDVPAFHEAFADIIALLQRFTITSLLENQIAKTSGSLSKFSFLGELATQFGNAMEEGRGGALRGAIGAKDDNGVWKKNEPDPNLYQTVSEPHKRGSVLVSTVFDAFIRLYDVKTADLLRIATNGTGILQPGAIHPDLVRRLSSEAAEIAEHLMHICIRALDYCPPVDIDFGDYLRALITADLDCNPKDDRGYRVALIEAFRSWGIFPNRVNTLSEESLVWSNTEHMTKKERILLNTISGELKIWVNEMVDLTMDETCDRELIYDQSIKVEKQLHQLMFKAANDSKNIGMTKKQVHLFMQKLGLTNMPITLEYNGKKVSSSTIPDLEVRKISPVYRTGREGKLVEQVLVTLTQTFRVKKGELKGAKFRGGCTIILNMGKGYEIDFIIYKNILSQHRFTTTMDYQTGKGQGSAALTDSMYSDGSGFDPVNFANLHAI